MKIENIEEGEESSLHEEDPVPPLPHSETEESKEVVESITEPTEPVTESHPRPVPYFKVLSPVPSISVSSLKGESPYSEREGTLTSEEDDKEFEDPVNNSVESNSTQSVETRRFEEYFIDKVETSPLYIPIRNKH